jgi:hypothetical protein
VHFLKEFTGLGADNGELLISQDLAEGLNFEHMSKRILSYSMSPVYLNRYRTCGKAPQKGGSVQQRPELQHS